MYSIEQVEGSTKLQDLGSDLRRLISAETSEKPQGFAMIMGNEVKGVKQNVVDMSDNCLEIPQFGTKHSLNVSTTTGIVIWEFVKHLFI